MIVAMAPMIASLAVVARPNIVYIMADDLGYRELGCYGQKLIPTPNIDKIAREGIRLTRAYSASPVCAPTRYSLLTGKHQGHAEIRGNKEQGGFGPTDPEGQQPVQASETLLPEVLRQIGYRTALVGKWGLGGPKTGERPIDHGFDFFYGYLCQRRAHNYYPAYLYRNGAQEPLRNPVFAAHQKIASPLSAEQDYAKRYAGQDYSPTKLAEACIEFIQTAKRDEPFLLYYAPTLPHVALQAPQEWVDRFPREWDQAHYLGANGYLPNPRPRATYAAMIAYLDHTVGLIDRELERKGLKQNTLIVFTSDNGAVGGVGGVDRDFFASNGELRAGKMSLYEGGIRVPMVARWPGRITPKSESDHVVTAYDMLPTLSAAAGAKYPKVDGQNMLSVFTGKPKKERTFAYFEYPEASVMQAVIFGRYKAIRPKLSKEISPLEIYDLIADPSEKKDLAGERPDLVRKASEILSREHKPNKLFPLGKMDQ